MKNLLSILLVVLLSNPVYAQSNSALKKTITVSAKTIRIDSLLNLFSRQTGMKFSFNSSSIRPSTKLSIARQKQTLSQWLEDFKSQANINHKIVGSHIILVPEKQAVTRKKVTSVANTQTRTRNKNSVSKSAPKTNTQQKVKTAPGDEIAVKSNAASTSIPKPDTSNSVPQVNTPDISKAQIKQNDVSKSLSREPIKNSTTAPPTINNTFTPTSDPDGKKERFQITGGYAKHGSGDLSGIIFGVEYLRYASEKFVLNYNFRGSIHNEVDQLFYRDITTGQVTEGALRFTTAGIQLGINGGLSLVNNKNHEFIISLGAFGRYQSSSGSNGYSTYNPAVTGVPNTILVAFFDQYPQKTYAIGGVLQVQYNLRIAKNFYIGVLPGFQTDTNGDAIIQLGFAIGKRYND